MNLTVLNLKHQRKIIVATAIGVILCSNVFGMISDQPRKLKSQIEAKEKNLSQYINFQQKTNQSEGIEVKIIRVKPQLNSENKFVGFESREETLQEVFVPFDKEKPDDVLAKTLTQKLPQNDYFIFEIANKSATEIVINANWIDDAEKCSHRNKNSESLQSEKVKWLGIKTESEVKEVSFILLAAKQMKPLDQIFTTVGYLAGIPTGRGEVNLNAIDAEVKQGFAKGKDEYANSRGEKITITLGNVYGKENLRSAEFYESLLNISNCSFTKQAKPKVRLEELKIGWLNNKALANYQTGNFEASKADYLKAWSILDQFDDYEFSGKELVETIILTNLGLVYATLNDHPTAISNYEQAVNNLQTKLLNLNAKEKLQRFGAVFNGLGTSWEALGDLKKASDYYAKALEAEREIGDKAGEGITLNSIARLMAKRGNLKDAELMYRQAIALSMETKNQAGIGSASNNLGALLLRQDKFDEARQAFLDANLIFKKLKNRTAQATALSNLMYVEQKANKNQTAIIYGKQSVNILQSVRKDISNIEVQLQKSFLLSRQQTYRNLADLLISEQRFAEAQMILGMLKDEEYSQISRAGEKGDTIPYSKSEDELIKLIESLADLANRRNELVKFKKDRSLTTDEDKEFSEIDEKIRKANGEFAKSLESLKKNEPTAKEMLDKIDAQKNISRTLGQFKKEIGSNAVAIYTVIGTEDEKNEKGEITNKQAKFGWMVLVTEKTSKAYPIDVKDLDSTVSQFRAALSSETYDPQPIAEVLYKKLFKHTSAKQKETLEADLQKLFANDQSPMILWSLDSILRYVPMAALHDGKQYLAEKYRQVVFTDQSLLGLSDSDSDWQVLGLGVSEAKTVDNENFPALPGVEKELKEIICQTDEKNCLIKGIRKLNKDFTKKETLKMWSENSYPVIHISSHFKFNPAQQEESFLLIGDGSMKFADFEGSQGMFNEVDLIALSACDTAMSSNGLESESLAYLVHKLGAKTVLASLWQVSDLGTPELMIRFYKQRAENPTLTKGEAFRQAQLSLLNGEEMTKVMPKPEVIKKAKDGRGVETFFIGEDKIDLPFYENTGKPKFAHPYYWASFVLIGNWK